MDVEGTGLGDRKGGAVGDKGGRGDSRVSALAAVRVVMPLPEPETTAVGGGLWWGQE